MNCLLLMSESVRRCVICTISENSKNFDFDMTNILDFRAFQLV